MNLHIATLNGLHVSPEAHREITDRERVVQEMAMHLIAGMTVGLDLSSDFDVIRYLKNCTPQCYRVKVITAHMDAAIYEARQIVIASVFRSV